MTDFGEIDIRPFRESDIPGFHAALDRVARELKYLTLLEAPPLNELRDFLMGELNADAPQFVAIAENRVIGWCDIKRHYFPAHAHRGTVGMGIVPEYRGRGIGARLLSAAIDKARAKDMLRIELSVNTDNEPAIRLYRKLGFVEEGIARKAKAIEGAYLDTMNMALLFI